MVAKLERSTVVTLGVLLLLVLAGASLPGYRWWKESQQASLRKLCAQASKDKAWDELESYATRWLEFDAKNGFAWLYLGEAVQAKGDFERAAECLGSLDESDPKCLPALLELVEMYLGKLNRPLDAVRTCRRIIAIDSGVIRAHQRLTFFYAMTLQRREMIRTIRKSIDRNVADPEAFVYLLLASSLRFSNGYQMNTHWLKSDPDNEHFQAARAIFLAKGTPGSTDIAEGGQAATVDPNAVSLVHQCREVFPGNPELLAYLLEVEVDAGNLDQVESLLAEAPTAAELDSRFWRFKGWYHAAVSQLEEAEEAYRESLRWDPYDWRSRHQLTTVLRRQNKLDEVAGLTELALEGKILEQALLEMPNTRDISVDMARDIAKLAEKIGDSQVADGIRRSLDRTN